MRGEGRPVAVLSDPAQSGSTRESVTVWGDGAVGITIAVALSRSCDVVLVGPPGGKSADVVLRCRGVFDGEARVRHVPSDEARPADRCVMAVKAGDLAAASVRSRETGNTSHACLCNGMGLDLAWGDGWQAVEKAVLLGGYERTGPWEVTTRPGGTYVLEGGWLAPLFRSSGIEIHVLPASELEAVRWAKWLVNSSLNPVAALTLSRNDELAPRGLAPLLYSLIQEMTAVVPAEYRCHATGLAGEMLGFLLAESSNKCSMLQDIEAGRSTEIEFMTGLAGRLLPGVCPLAGSLTTLLRARASQSS